MQTISDLEFVRRKVSVQLDPLVPILIMIHWQSLQFAIIGIQKKTPAWTRAGKTPLFLCVNEMKSSK